MTQFEIANLKIVDKGGPVPLERPMNDNESPRSWNPNPRHKGHGNDSFQMNTVVYTRLLLQKMISKDKIKDTPISRP
jgi:hypothetical protein